MTGRTGLAIVGASLRLAGGPGCDQGDTLAAPTLTAACVATP